MVKAMLLFFMVGLGFLAHGAYEGVLLYRMVQGPAEYVLAGNGQNAVSRTKLEDIQKLPHVGAVSRQAEIAAAIKIQGEEYSFACAVLSEAYMEKAYGIRESRSMWVFYMNQAAYRQLKESLSNPQTLKSDEKNRLSVRYRAEGQESADAAAADGQSESPQWKMAEIQLVEEGVPQEEPYVFCKGNGLGITGESSRVRVWLSQRELDGMHVERLQGTGLAMENKEAVQKEEFQRELQVNRIGYGMLVSLVSFACAGVLRGFWKKRA